MGFHDPIPVGILRNLSVSGGVGTRTGVSALQEPSLRPPPRSFTVSLWNAGRPTVIPGAPPFTPFEKWDSTVSSPLANALGVIGPGSAEESSRNQEKRTARSPPRPS